MNWCKSKLGCLTKTSQQSDTRRRFHNFYSNQLMLSNVISNVPKFATSVQQLEANRELLPSESCIPKIASSRLQEHATQVFSYIQHVLSKNSLRLSHSFLFVVIEVLACEHCRDSRIVKYKVHQTHYFNIQVGTKVMKQEFLGKLIFFIECLMQNISVFQQLDIK